MINSIPFQLIQDNMLLDHVCNTLKAVEKPLFADNIMKEKINLGKAVEPYIFSLLIKKTILLTATFLYDGETRTTSVVFFSV